MSLTPSPEQQGILDLGLTSIRVRAGAGTGKTTTVAMVIANLVGKHGIEPERILGMTFTNKAAAELSQRVSDLLPSSVEPARQVEVHTYHGFGAQILSEFGALAELDTRAGIITPTFARQIIRDVFFHRSYELVDMTYAGTLDNIRKLSDQLGDHLLRPEDLIEASRVHVGDEVWEARVEMAEALADYNAAKAELGVVDYADLVTLSTRLLQRYPALASTIRGRYQALVLDEYQDTNPAQRVLLTTIFDGGFPVIAVGDEDQTIYEWRGASAENFDRFIDHFPTAAGTPAHAVSLTLSRRSGQGILDIANQVRRKANSNSDLLEAASPSATEVVTYWATDALAESDWIARQFEALHDAGTPWSDMAVLLRKNKDFAVVIDVMSQHDVPIEVANVGGLLSVPEISQLRAWLSVLHNPEDSTSLAQILLGSGYRLGIAELAILTNWLTHNQPDDGDEEIVQPITLIEAVENAASVDGIGPETRRRFARFHATYRELLVETQGLSLSETCRLVLDRTRAWHDIESLPPNPRLTARLNIYRFLDLADDWSPLSGRPSLGAFLDYLEAMEDEPAEELDMARLSGEDAVTLVTVHRAKGLEWENVAVPAVVDGGFPARSGGFADPTRFPHHLPVEFRLDNAIRDLPDDRKARDAFLRDRHYAQEWRVAYVAFTRAKRRLLVTGAYWYGHPEPRATPAKPSQLFELVEDHPATIRAGHADLVPRPDILRAPDDLANPDPLFEGGWQEGLKMGRESPELLEQLARALGLEDRYGDLVGEWNDRLFDLAQLGGLSEESPEEESISVTGLVTYAQCPKRYYWSEVDPLPRRRSNAAILGSQVHRRIELHQRGQVPFDDFEPGLYDLVGDSDQPGGYAAYEDSRFAEDKAALVEAPFSLELENRYQVRGRIDAVYETEGHWEVVDFKTGRPNDDSSRIVQLQAYAVAAHEVPLGLAEPRSLDVTFAYLGGGLEEVRIHTDEAWVSAAKETLNQLTDEIRAGEFGESTGTWCRTCDFLRFCEPGQNEVEA